MSCSGSSMQNVTIHTGDDARLLVNFVDCAGIRRKHSAGLWRCARGMRRRFARGSSKWL